VAQHHPAKSLLHRVDAARGLGATDYATLEKWMRFERPQRKTG
jgi:hypothetical protein